jgi:hypothetical protein
MRPPANEFSDLDRSIVSPDGTTFEFVCHVASGVSGWALLWGRGKRSSSPIITIYANGEAVRQELSADRHDAERIIDGLEAQLQSGTLEDP